MKVITEQQPRAQLIALNVLHVLPRSKPTKYRGPLLIHAGVHAPKTGAIGPWHVWNESGHVWWLDGRNGDPESNNYYALPLGAIVASCTLVDVVPIVGVGEETAVRRIEVGESPDSWGNVMLIGPHPDDQEEGVDFDGSDFYEANLSEQRPYGDFTPGRFAWILEDIKPTTERCPECWIALAGTGEVVNDVGGYISLCPTCCGSKVCDPIPAKGHQGLWNWNP